VKINLIIKYLSEEFLGCENLYRYWNIKERFKMFLARHSSYVSIRYDQLSSLRYDDDCFWWISRPRNFRYLRCIEGVAGRKGSSPKFDIISRVISR